MPVPDRERARHMVVRVERALRREGIAGGEVVSAAVEWGLQPRHELLDDDHDPRYLHPGRSVLVALGDGGIRDPELLAVAALLETTDPDLRAGAPDAEGEAHPTRGLGRAWSRAVSLPSPWDEAVVEGLVVEEPGMQAVALSEWLDQLRHLRHWAGSDVVEKAHEVTARVHLPLARRGHDQLARRLEWWMRRVARF